MDKKQRKANEALKKSQDYLKMKSKQQVKQLVKEEPIDRRHVLIRHKKQTNSGTSIFDRPSLEGEVISTKVALLNRSLPSITIDGRKSILLKGQCVILNLIRKVNGLEIFAVMSADGRVSTSYSNPTNVLP